MANMYNPPHPGELIREFLGDVTITSAAERLGVECIVLQRVVDGEASVLPDMASRLAVAFGTSVEVWTGMQMQYDRWQSRKA